MSSHQERDSAPTGATISFDAGCSAARRAEVEAVCVWWASGASTYTLPTSGSTGIPKLLVFDRRHIEASAADTIAHFGLQSGQSSPLLLSAESTGGFMMLIRALLSGLKLEVFEVSRRPATRPGQCYDFVALVPEQAAALSADPHFKPEDYRCTLLGGAPLRPDLEDALAAWPHPTYQGYGMTETLSHVALRRVGRGSTYKALPGVFFDQIGEALLVDAPSRGVHNLLTTDAATLYSSSEFQWLGRLDGAIISAGKKIFPEVIEALGGSRGLAVGVPNALWGQMLVWVEPTGGDITMLAQKWKSLPSWQQPKHIVQREIPYLSSGKPDRQALAQWAAQELALR
ncbi:MAG: hypothetical protein CK537_01820 [Flavobacteriales bacterium]|nr:MAG: hypothetical protein CK537_01820 [Flavobacteriales bacterium]